MSFIQVHGRRVRMLGVSVALAALGLAGGPAAFNEVAHAATASTGASVIVGFRAGSPTARLESLSTAAEPSSARTRSLAQATGLRLRNGLPLGARTQVIESDELTAEQLAARLATQPDVEYAVVNRRKRLAAAPNDPLYAVGGSSGPVAGQWYLRPPNTTTVSGINAEAAWDTSTGSSSVVVAVLDTGVRFDHADLVPVESGGNLLRGYDFITRDDIGNDNDPGRDADAADPGDWITTAENTQTGGPFKDCGVSNSSWHGTEVAGLIGAATNNGTGMASVGRAVRVLPVRVLGKCGGLDSDIIAGMRWAAGLSVPGVPINTNPAKVINLSLGGEGACTAAYRAAVAEINAAGAVVVASAGNSAGHAVSEPANCEGVIAVAGLRHAGTKVGFSDLGPEIALSAPGGNCVDVTAGAACQYPILTTRNAGTTTPIAGSSAYSDAFRITVGTSFSAPLVAGAAALLYSVKPSITPTELRLALQQNARAFPTTGGDNGDGTVVAQCRAPQFDAAGKPIDQLQCYCTTTTCGAGMLDVAASVRAVALTVVAPPVVVTPPVTPPVTTPVASTGGGGGGALGWPWLLALGLAGWALRRTGVGR